MNKCIHKKKTKKKQINNKGRHKITIKEDTSYI